MGNKTEDDNDEARRLDREYTGDAVNARTHELKEELNAETEQLKRQYEESRKSKTDDTAP